MECVAEWSLVEMDVIMTFSRLSGGPPALATQIYAELSGKGPKTAALIALSRFAIADENLDIFNLVRTLTRSCELRRNRIVHWTWGFFHDRDDAILLVDPNNLVIRKGNLDEEKIQVWFKSDFTNLAQEIRDLSTNYHLMSGLAARRPKEEQDETARLLRKRLGI